MICISEKYLIIHYITFQDDFLSPEENLTTRKQPKKRMTLRSSAIPSIFPWTQQKTERKAPRERSTSLQSPTSSASISSAEENNRGQGQGLEDSSPTSSRSISSSEENNRGQGQDLFEDLSPTSSRSLSSSEENSRGQGHNLDEDPILPTFSLRGLQDHSYFKTKSAPSRLIETPELNEALEAPPEVSIGPLSLDDLWQSQAQQIAKLEDKVKELKCSLEAFEKLFNPDQLEKLKGRKVVSWSDNTITKGIQTKYVVGSTGYKYLRSLGFPFPSETSLNDRTRMLDVQPGIIDDSFKLLSLKTPDWHPNECDAVLVLDEKAIEENIQYDVRRQTIIGNITTPRNSENPQNGKNIVPQINFSIKVQI